MTYALSALNTPACDCRVLCCGRPTGPSYPPEPGIEIAKPVPIRESGPDACFSDRPLRDFVRP